MTADEYVCDLEVRMAAGFAEAHEAALQGRPSDVIPGTLFAHREDRRTVGIWICYLNIGTRATRKSDRHGEHRIGELRRIRQSPPNPPTGWQPDPQLRAYCQRLGISLDGPADGPCAPPAPSLPEWYRRLGRVTYQRADRVASEARQREWTRRKRAGIGMGSAT